MNHHIIVINPDDSLCIANPVEIEEPIYFNKYKLLSCLTVTIVTGFVMYSFQFLM